MNVHLPGPGYGALDGPVGRENLHSAPSPTLANLYPASPPAAALSGKTPGFQNKFYPASWPPAGEGRPEYTPGGFCLVSSFEGRDNSSCGLFSA